MWLDHYSFNCNGHYPLVLITAGYLAEHCSLNAISSIRVVRRYIDLISDPISVVSAPPLSFAALNDMMRNLRSGDHHCGFLWRKLSMPHDECINYLAVYLDFVNDFVFWWLHIICAVFSPFQVMSGITIMARDTPWSPTASAWPTTCCWTMASTGRWRYM